MKTFSPFRNAQHKFYNTLTLDGTVLDIGGDKNGVYQGMIKGNKKVFTANIPGGHAADVLFDANEKFPIKDEEYDNIICINVLEHLHKPEVAIAEMIRVVKKGGKLIIVAPFMYHMHGSPFDYVRFTPAYFDKRAAEHNFTIIKEQHFAPGLFTHIFQGVGGAVPTTFLKSIGMWLCEKIDKVLSVSSGYRKLSARLTIGLCYVWQKN